SLSIPLDEAGVPCFDSQTMRVGDLDVFIAGDVTGQQMILHEAADEGRIAGFNATREQPHCFRRRAPLAICFTDPNIATAGKRFSEVESLNPVVGEVSFED